VTSASEARGVEKTPPASADARRRAKRDRLRYEREAKLREVGDQEANGRRQLAERSARQRAEVWADFRAKMEKLG
jgi:hypothetical protein